MSKTNENEYDIIRGGNLNKVIVGKGSDGRFSITPILIITVGSEDNEVDMDDVESIYNTLNGKLEVPFLVVPEGIDVSFIEAL